MAHNVFISYASPDKATADAVCARLEQRGARCWIAPRDVRPGYEWPAEIASAIPASSVVVLVFSSHANKSEQIRREINIAANFSKPIIPFRIENVQPVGSLLFFISDRHWLDALTPELEKGLTKLAETVERLIDLPGYQDARTEDSRLAEYRAAVVVAWSNGVISSREVEALNAIALSLQLDPRNKLEIEKAITGYALSDLLHRESRGPSDATTANSNNGNQFNPAPRQDTSQNKKAIYCRKCGTQLTLTNKFCRKCGTSLLVNPH